MVGFALPVSVIEADWSGDGTWSTVGTIGALASTTIADLGSMTIADLDTIGAGAGGSGAPLSDHCLETPGASAARGRNLLAASAPPLANEVTLALDNRSGAYSPDNAGSAYYPHAGTGLPVRWRFAWASGSYPVVQGLTTEWATLVGAGASTVAVSGLSQLGRLVGRRGYTSQLWGDGTLAGGVRTDQALGYVFDLVGLSRRRFDAGLTTLLYFWVEPEDELFDLAVRIWAAEGAGARLYDAPDDYTVFKNRDAERTEARSTTVQATSADRDDGATPWSSAWTPDAGDRNVINRASLGVARRVVDGADAVVWSYGATLTLGPNATRQLEGLMPAGSPLYSMPVLAPGTDYTVTAGALTDATLWRVNGASVQIHFAAGPAGATVTGIQARGRLLRAAATTTIADAGVDTAASIQRFGERRFGLPSSADLDPNAAQDLVNAIVLRGKDPRPVVSVEVPLVTAANCTATLAREVGDRVAVVSARASFNRAMLVESVRVIHGGGRAPTAVLGCEAAIDTAYARWDAGVWDTDRWGY